MIRIGYNCIATSKIEYVKFTNNNLSPKIELYTNNNLLIISHRDGSLRALEHLYYHITYAIEGIYPECKLDKAEEYECFEFFYKSKR